MGLNIAIQQGRLVADPLIYTGHSEKGDYIYARFRIAVARDYKEKDRTKKTDFKNCEATGQVAKFVQDFYRKGDLVIVEGPWYTKDYTKDGENRSYDYLSVHRTYPSNLRGEGKAMEENLADTKKMDNDIPPLPEEYQNVFK